MADLLDDGLLGALGKLALGERGRRGGDKRETQDNGDAHRFIIAQTSLGTNALKRIKAALDKARFRGVIVKQSLHVKSRLDPTGAFRGRWRGPSGPLLGAAFLPDAGREAQARSARSVCVGRASRRHRRALVLLHHQGGQRPADRAGRRSELHRIPRQEGAAARSHRDRWAIEFLGAEVMQQYGGWNLLCKFFDNLGPIPHHLHQNDEFAARVGQKGKPEAYYFPPQYNFKDNNFPYTFMGLNPGTTRDDLRRCLERWNEGDNGILYLSRAYKLKPGTGWQVDPGILHAPGSLVTYEPQVNSDVFAMYQSLVEGRGVPWDLLVKDVPEEHHHDLDYLLDMLDWEANTDPDFSANRQFEPKPVCPPEQMADAGLLRKLGGLLDAALLGQGTHGLSGPHRHDSGRGRLRNDPGARLGTVRQTPGGDAVADPLWPDDQRRTVRLRGPRPQRHRCHEPERDGEHGFPETLRSGQFASTDRAVTGPGPQAGHRTGRIQGRFVAATRPGEL